MDQYWLSALMETLAVVNDVDIMFSPSGYGFMEFSSKFYPYEYSFALKPGVRFGICIHKDQFHAVCADVVEQIDKPTQVVFENDVFIIVTSTDRYRNNLKAYKSWMTFRDLRLRNILGKNQSSVWAVEGQGTKKALVVGASNMGNIGDDLIAKKIGGIILGLHKDYEVHYCDFNITYPDLDEYDLVVVGGGGIVYSSQFVNNECQNLANYFKVPIWCKKKNISCIAMGIG